MTELERIKHKIHSFASIQSSIKAWKNDGDIIVFTNGCFDILHYGHLHYLAAARDLGNRLVVGLNSAASVSRLKGAHRPLNDELTRQYSLAALAFVDAIVVFEEDTPLVLLECVMPDILVKGGDYQLHQIVGADLVIANGGKVLSLPFVDGFSTTKLEQKIKLGQ